MRQLRYVKNTFDDLKLMLCNNKLRTLLCAVAAIVGVVVGAIFVNVFRNSWWYVNRYDYALRLFEGGFSLFFSFLLFSACFYALTVCCCMLPQTRYLACVVLAVACFYCGANAAAAIICRTVWGILFAVLVSLVEIVGYFLTCLPVCCQPACSRSFREAICDTKISFFILSAAFLTKIFTFFVVLQLLTAVI